VSTPNRKTRRFGPALGLAMILLAIAAPTAMAGVEFEVDLSHSETEVSHSDKRVDYIAKVTNIGDTPTINFEPFEIYEGTFELELPGGQDWFVVKTNQSNTPPFVPPCVFHPASGPEHAKFLCEGSVFLFPGQSMQYTFSMGIAMDAPDLAIAEASISGGMPGSGPVPPAGATEEFTFGPAVPFGINAFAIKIGSDPLINAVPESEPDFNRAGGHPLTAGAEMLFNRYRGLGDVPFTPPGSTYNRVGYSLIEHTKNVNLDAARGFVGNALAVPELCPGVEYVVTLSCPSGSKVGAIVLGGSGLTATVPIFALEPEFGTAAQFVFSPIAGSAFTFVTRLRPDDGYAISFQGIAPEVPELQLIKPVLCGFGLKETGSGIVCKDRDEPGANPLPLITNPTRCAGPPPTANLRVSSWEHPLNFVTKGFSTPQIEECENVPFEPKVELKPTNRRADAPTGLDVEFTMPTDGLEDPDGVAQATLNNAIVTFPEGMTVNPSSAAGLGACSLGQLKFHSNEADECPESSRIGSVEIETPLIREKLTGSVYLAKQNENPFNSAFGVYMVFSSARDGVTVKVAGKLVPDPETGQLVSTFAESPEWPFSRLVLHFNSGPRAPLINPPKCGTYAIRSELSPWSAVNPANPTPDEIVSHDSTYEVNSGPNGGPCPTGSLEPKLNAGVQNPTAGAKTPFLFSLSRDDGTQRFRGVDVVNPAGLTAAVKGIPYCGEPALAAISGAEETGRVELANPSCPAASQIGTSEAGSGAGPLPFYVKTGKTYLAGPYKGAPVSLAVITPAVAGPFDLGSVLVRVPLYVDPVSSQITAKSDSIPTALHGIVLDVRDIRLALDRPNFTQAPTNCEPRTVDAHVLGQEGAEATVSNRFQVGGCENLGFKPGLSFRLFGGTQRGSHPKLRAILKARPGDANIAAASVALPRSEFLDQAHIKTVCTRVQFAAKACPPGSIYGEAEATTPLLDNPVKGPVYLRSSNNQLPDLVAALRGPDSQPIEVHLVGRIDSVNGGIRSTFDVVPDQPVTQFTLTMQGGKKGLLVNSRNICASTWRATAVFTGQNGKQITMRPKMQSACKKAKKTKKGAKKRRHSR
jgi:hypothetical protein